MKTVFVPRIVLAEKRCAFYSCLFGIVFTMVDKDLFTVLVIKEYILVEERLSVGNHERVHLSRCSLFVHEILKILIDIFERNNGLM